MKIITFLVMLLISVISFAQNESTSFEEPEAIGGNYIDTGDATMSHDLIDNVGEPFVNFTATGEELGFSAFYVPYDNPGIGLTDGDSVGVTSIAPGSDHPFPDGVQGYKISDVDGNFILKFDEFELTGIGAEIFINYFIADTGFEGDGTENASGSDRVRIYLKNLTDNTEQDILNSTGKNINDLSQTLHTANVMLIWCKKLGTKKKLSYALFRTISFNFNDEKQDLTIFYLASIIIKFVTSKID